MTREQLIADRADFDAKNRLLDEEYRRLQNALVAIEDLLRQRVATRQGLKTMDLTTLISKLDTIADKLGEIVALRRT